ncbi:HpaII family restriction endonuclease [Vibrio breoganii]
MRKNAGDWAEFYVLLKVLGDGKLYSADGDLNTIPGQYFPVISVEMQKSGLPAGSNEKLLYTVDTKSKTVEIVDSAGSSVVSMQTLLDEAKDFFEIIKTRAGRAFAVPEITPILNKLGNPETKQSANKKADIHIVIHDIMTGFENEVGFSIKSKHSKPATLINASGQTLFQYKILDGASTGSAKKKEALKVVDDTGAKIGPKTRVQNLIGSGFKLSFECVKKNEFRENLQLIDSLMDEFLAECLIVFMTTGNNSVEAVVNEVAERNPCKYKTKEPDRVLEFYQYKMKRLLTDAALGMQPRARWDGTFDASGGYIVVKEVGEVVCYHLFNWNALQDYLFKNMRFETPSSTGTGSKSSFNYGLYYEDNAQSYMDICLQLRFK